MGQFPVYKKGSEIYSEDIFIVRFDNETECEVVFSTDSEYPVGKKFSPKTRVSDDRTWEDVHFDPEFNFFETQPMVQFYGGSIYFNFYDHTREYSGEIIPFEAPHPEWMIEQYQNKFIK